MTPNRCPGRALKPAGRLVFVSLMAGAVGGGHVLPAANVAVPLIHGFDGASQGAKPNAGLIIDKHGVLYGVTFAAGAGNSGTVFSLTPPSALRAPWVETTLWSFTGSADGASPIGSLIQDNAGALYGTASGGGAYHAGTVFKLVPPAAGQTAWTETTLWSFNPTTDGGNPSAGLIAGPDGSLYGTAASFGEDGYGTVFRLTSPTSDRSSWTYSTLWSFTNGLDGGLPTGSLLLDIAGNLYGTATRGGTDPIGGVVFELSPASGGAAWAETTLYNFTGPDGLHPAAALIADNAGALYGTTAFGGANGRGTVFQLTPPAGGIGTWTRTTLSDLSPTAGGVHPFSPLLFDAAGTLYGTTYGYSPEGYYDDPATIFSLAPPAQTGGAWTVTTLAIFDPKKNGLNVVGGLVPDKQGHLFGTVVIGSRAGVPAAGGVFQAIFTGFKPFK